MTAARQVGIGGIGLLGNALAHRLLTSGFTPKGFDIDAGKTAAFAQAGGTAASLEEVARCDVVLLALFDTTQVEDVVTNALLPAAIPGTPKTVLCASTCDPDRIAALIARVAPRLRMIEAPVSGSSAQVRNGEGVGLIGGERDTIDSVTDILDALYPKWFFMGAAGNGGRAKLAINHMLGLNRLVLAEGLVFAERTRARPEKLPRRGAPVGRLQPSDGYQGAEDGERRLHAAGLHPSVAERFSFDPGSGGEPRSGDATRGAQRGGAASVPERGRRRARQFGGDRGTQTQKEALMRRSEKRILTTHTGSLPRPPELTRLYARRARGEPVDAATLQAAGRAALRRIVPKQIEAGIDVGNNGEQQRNSFLFYIRDRLTGLGGSWQRRQRADVERYPIFMKESYEFVDQEGVGRRHPRPAEGGR